MCIGPLNGSLIAAEFRMNRLQYVAIPRTLDISSDVAVCLVSLIAYTTFSWVGETLFPLKCNQKKLISSHIFKNLE
jgi:hypothetical protein